MLKKRFMSAATALIIAAGMSGCGNSDTAADSKKAAKSDAATNGGAAAAAATEAAGEKSGGEVYETYDGGAAVAEDTAKGDATYAEADGYALAAEGEAPMAKVPAAGDVVIDEPPVDPEPAPAPGQLTAGEWKDNDNWGFFENLVNSGTIGFPSFGLDPTVRTAVTVNDPSGAAVVNAQVRLMAEDGSVLWTAVTDKQGKAYLFGRDAASVEVSSGGAGESYPIEGRAPADEQTPAATDGSREMTVTFSGESRLYSKTEIMFIVDTTGSMGDEMMFLQSEFTAITEAVGTDNVQYSVNFYRDLGDDYVTRTNPFTTDITDIQRKLNAESANGGGDLPEAVAEIFNDCLTNGTWSEDSVKIAFLIFDAPPHDGKEDMLKEAINTAAAKGIRLVPVVSSNSDRATELFARAVAIETGGTYVFLTSDSGIGDSHLEPIIGSYEVEKLYDIIIRVIGEYRQ